MRLSDITLAVLSASGDREAKIVLLAKRNAPKLSKTIVTYNGKEDKFKLTILPPLPQP